MFEKFMTTNIGDFRQRYRGTFGFFHRDNEKTLVCLENVDTERRTVVFRDIKGNDFTLIVNHDDNIGFSFIAPKAQWHNTQYGPLLVGRIPQKQYRRGICEANTSIVGASGTIFPVDFVRLNAIFVEPTSFEETLQKLEAAAISPQFMVNLHTKRIKCMSTNIGSCGRDGKGVFQVKLDDAELFRQEVLDAFKRANLEVNLK